MDVEASSGLIGTESVGFPVMNQSGLSDSMVVQSGELREVAQQLQKWVDNARAATGKGMFERGRFVPPDNPYNEMRVARAALKEDDIVGGVADTTESFAFNIVKWEGEDFDLSDIFNQWAREVNLDSFVRELWREVFGVSQAIVAMEWGWREYKVRGKTKGGNARKAKKRLYVPTKLRVMDTSRVVPVGFSPMGDDWLAWQSSTDEINYWGKAQRKEIDDPMMSSLFLGRYQPSEDEKKELVGLGVDADHLMLCNPEMVWRHTLTKPAYERFADVRMKSLFKLLDLKQQLMASDRSTLIGAANYILLIRKGTKEQPGTEEELRNLRENYNYIAKLPVIISDHRLEVEIVAPKVDFTLQQERYDLLDARILMRLLGTLSPGARGQRNETNVTISAAVARSIENRRHMLRRAIEGNVAKTIVEHPNNAEALKDAQTPSLVFVPRNVSLEIDAAFIQAIMNLRSRWEISRESILEYFGFDQSVEAQRRELEEEQYDEIFKTTTPFDSPENSPGDGGGRPVGGGDSPQDATKVSKRTSQGNKSTSGGS